MTIEKNIRLSLLTLLFLAAPFFVQYHIAGEGLFMPFNVTEWLVMSWIIGFSLYTLTSKHQLVLPRHYWAFLALPLGIVVSGFITGIQLPVNWLFRVLFIFGGVSFLFLLFQSNFNARDVNRILLIVVLSTLINAIIGALQIHFPSQVIDLLPAAQGGRPTGAFQQVNTNASYLATGLLISFYLAASPAHQLGRDKWQNLKIMTLAITIALSAYIIMLSASRVGTLSVGVGFIIILICRWPQLRRKKIVLSIILTAFLGGAVMGNSGVEQLGKKFDNTFEQYSSARMGIYQVSLEIIKQKMFFGHGIGSFDQVFVEQAAVYLSDAPESNLANIPSINHPHNEFFFWLIEGGIISIIGILVAGFAVVLALIRVGWSRGGAYGALLLPISFHTQVELPFYLSAIHWFLFLFIIFIVLRHNIQVVSFMPSRSFKLLSKISAVTLVIISTFFLVNTLRANQGIVQYNKEATGNVHLLEDALNNIYFNNYAERSIMAMSGVYSIAHNEKAKTITFTQWAENYLQLHPDYVVREILVKAYRYLGDEEKMCMTLNKGLFLYPKNLELLKLNDEVQCEE